MENIKVKVVSKIEILDEEGVKTGKFLQKGSIQEVPVELANQWIEAKLATLVEDKPEESKVVEAKVYNKNDQVVRVYSLEVHGKEFVKLAKSFAAKFGYSLK